MKRRLLTLLSSSILLSGVFASPAMAIDLQEALVSAYNTNPSLLAERENLKTTDELVSQALSGWFPSASFTAEHGRQSIHAENNANRTSTTQSRRLNLNQPVFNGGETVAQTNRAKNLVKSGQATLERTEQNVMLDAVTVYMNLFQAQEVMKYSQTNKEVLEKHLEFANNRFSLGEVTRTDVAQSRSRLARGISDNNRARGDWENTRASFKRVTGIDPDVAVFPDVTEDLPATLDEAISIAQKNNPQIRAVQFDTLAAKNAVSASKAVLLPSVSLRAEMQKTDGFINLGGQEYDTTTALINVTVPLYQSGSEYSRIRSNKNVVERRKFDTRNALDTITDNTIRAWSNLQTARANIQSTSNAVDAAATALEGVTRESEAGTRTTLDVLDAEQELFVSKVEHTRARRDEIVSIYTLKAALGQLTAKTLSLPVAAYDPTIHYDKTKFRPAGF